MGVYLFSRRRERLFEVTHSLHDDVHCISSALISLFLDRLDASIERRMNALSAVKKEPKSLKHKRRFCRIGGCQRIVKSQGVCQRHGAKPRLCKVATCEKQAQGNFDGTTAP